MHTRTHAHIHTHTHRPCIYNERLSILKLPILECHRAYTDLRLMFKITMGFLISLSKMFPHLDFIPNFVLRHHPNQNLPQPSTAC